MDALSELSIEPARAGHLPAVTALAKMWKIEPEEVGEISSQGFLMAGWRLQDYQTFLDEAEHFVVVTHRTKVVGFLCAYRREHAHLDPWLHRELAHRFDDYVLLEQICVDPEWANRGVGSCLMSHLLQLCAEIPMISEIAREPLNKASVGLHQKFGFTPLLECTRPSGFPVTLWVGKR